MPHILATEPLLFDVPSYGRSDLKIRQFADDGQGNLYLRTPRGLFRRDSCAGTWSHVEAITVNYNQWVEHIDAREGHLFVLNTRGTLYRSSDQGDTFKAKATRAKGVNRVLFNPAYDVALVGGDSHAYAGSTAREVGAFVTGALQKKPDLIHVGRSESMWPCCLHQGAIVSGQREVKALEDPEQGWVARGEEAATMVGFDMLVSTGEALVGATSRSYDTRVTTIQRSEDGGATWKRVYAGDENLVGLTSDDAGRVVAATRLDLIVSADHGESWHVAPRDGVLIFDQVHLCDGKLWASVFEPEGHEVAYVDAQGHVLVHVLAFPGVAQESSQSWSWERAPHGLAPSIKTSDLPKALPTRAPDEVVDVTSMLYLSPDTLLTADATGRLLRWARRDHVWSLDATLLGANAQPITSMIVDGGRVFAARRGALCVFDPASGEVIESYPVGPKSYFWLHRHGDIVVAAHSGSKRHDGSTKFDGLDRFRVEGGSLVALEPLPGLPSTSRFLVTIDHVDALDQHVLYVNKLPNSDASIWKVFDLDTEEVVDGQSKSIREMGLMPSDHSKLWAMSKTARLKTGVNSSTGRGGKNQGATRTGGDFVTHVSGAYIVDHVPGDHTSCGVVSIEPFAPVATATGLFDLFKHGTHVCALAPDASSLIVSHYGSTPHTVCLETDARVPLGTPHPSRDLAHVREVAFSGAWMGLASTDTHAYFLHDAMLIELDLATGATTTLGGPIDAELTPEAWIIDGYWVATTRDGLVLIHALETGARGATLEFAHERLHATLHALYVLAPPPEELAQPKPELAIWRVNLETGELARVAPEVLGVARVVATSSGLIAVWYDHGMGGEYVYYDEQTDTVTDAPDVNIYMTPHSHITPGKTLLHVATRGSSQGDRWYFYDTSSPFPELLGAGFSSKLGHPTMLAGSARAYAYSAASEHILTAIDKYNDSKGVRVCTLTGYRVGVIGTPTTPQDVLIASPEPQRFFIGTPATGFDLVVY